jgi:nucleoid-associated protein YgaU
MAAGRGKEIAIAIVGLIAFAAILVRFGMLRHAETPVAPVQIAAPAAAPATAPPPPAPAAPAVEKQAAAAAPPAATPPAVAIAQPPTVTPAPAPVAPPRVDLPRPTFDIVRVEPDGSSVVAGRGAPGVKVEMLRNGVVHDSVVADAGGQFAMTPPPFPEGPSEVTLRLTGPEGTSSISAQSVTVVVAQNRRDVPLVALADPDKPTAILSQPAAPAVAAAAAPAASGDKATASSQMSASGQMPASGQITAQNQTSGDGRITPPGQGSASAPATPPASSPAQASPPAQVAAANSPAPSPAPAATPAPAPRQALRVVSVEAEEGGKLFVTGQGAAGANVRLYLNDTFIAPGVAGPDGKIVFSIQRGVTAGDYRVRLDEVGGGDGVVATRAEVPFTMPAPMQLAMPALPPPVTPLVTGLGSAPAPQAQTQAPPSAPPSAAVAAAPAAPAAVQTEQPGSPGTVVVPQVNTAVVVRGDSLWRISRRVYGRGLRYTVIYEANQDQIRNPRRIYPGQIFVLPGAEGAAAVAAPR